MPQSRRHFLMALFTLAALPLVPATALADQGSGGGGSGGSGSGGSDGGGSGSGDSGGNGEGGDNDGDDGGDNGGDDKGKGGDDDKVDHNDARDAVKSGEAMSLRKAMKRAKEQTSGRIIDVSLARKSSKFIYVFTVVQPSGRIETLKMDAISGKFAGLLGF
jgi:hypothetical protein